MVITNHKFTIRLFIILFLSFHYFYNPNFIEVGVNFWKAVEYFLLILTGFYVFQNKGRGYLDQQRVFYLVGFFLVCQLFSSFNSYIFKGQDFIISIIATLQYIGFISYIYLSKSRLQINNIEKIISFFTYVYIILSILNYICGNAIFGSYEIDLDRGGMRYRLLGLDWVMFSCYLNINKYVVHLNKIFLIKALFLFSFVILSLTRQYIFITFVLMLLMIIHKAKLYQKIFIILALFLFAFFIIPHINIFNKLVNLSYEQANADYDNIRLVSFNYYALEYPRNIFQTLFGVGVPSFGNSSYGNEIDQIEQFQMLYTSDLGYVDLYFKFGIISVLLIILMQFYCLKRPTRNEYIYAKYYLISNLFLAIASTPYLSNPISICVAMYILTNVETSKKDITRNLSNNEHK